MSTNNSFKNKITDELFPKVNLKTKKQNLAFEIKQGLVYQKASTNQHIKSILALDNP